jgi:hypothetical protein
VPEPISLQTHVGQPETLQLPAALQFAVQPPPAQERLIDADKLVKEKIGKGYKER